VAVLGQEGCQGATMASCMPHPKSMQCFL
jgi:hypothetical protein